MDGLSYLQLQQQHFKNNNNIQNSANNNTNINTNNNTNNDTNNNNINNHKIDFLIIDAFEDSPHTDFGPHGVFSNRAPPLSILSDLELLIKPLKPFKKSVKTVNFENRKLNLNVENITSYLKENKNLDKNLIDNKNDNTDENNNSNKNDNKGEKDIFNGLLNSDRGGILMINLYGPPEWVENVFNIINNCPQLSKPFLIKIKDHKNIVLLTSRLSSD